MRSRGDLKFILDRALLVSGGTCPMWVEAEDETEAEAFRDLLKGRRGNASLTVMTTAQIKARKEALSNG